MTERKPLPENYLELTGMSDEAVAAKTGRTWPEWVKALDAIGADKMQHPEIAKWVKEETGLAWWAQSVTVGYERIRGLRAVGQQRAGEFETSRSKTFDVPVERLFEAFANDELRGKWLDAGVSISKATPHRSVRMRLPDGSPAEAYLTAKGEAKASAQVQVRKLPSKEAADDAKAAWGARLDALTKLLS